MSAAAVSISAPLAREASQFWQHLTEECKRQVEHINAVVTEKGLSADHLIRCIAGSELHLMKSGNPSTTVTLSLAFHPWGPVMNASVTGRQTNGSEFFPEFCELPIAVDGDGTVVAIFDEGRSFSPRELAMYLTQSFRRCFPGVCLCR